MSVHSFHIPVMGTGFSLDSPLRVARFGISSVMSIVDDTLIERVRRRHAAKEGLAYEPIGVLSFDARARRITAWLDLVDAVIARQMATLRALPFADGNEKTKYFELLPDGSPLARAYRAYLAMPDAPAKKQAGAVLTSAIVAGSADVNIMTKVDRARFDLDGNPLGSDHADAKAALRGFAESRIASNLVFSAGMNPTLFGLIERFADFYRDSGGHIRKGIILKVSDFRSALVQGKFLAKKGIEIRELRIESGLNCGGHLFATDGELLGPILAEICNRRDELVETFAPAIRQYYEKKGTPFVGEMRRIRVTVQGGIGTHGEARRLCEHYGADATGWGSPFLLVREATALDDATRALLASATEADIYVSDASPLGIPFSNVRGSSSELWTTQRIEDGRPGSSCPRGYLASNTELTERPICTASREYQRGKLAAMGYEAAPPPGTSDPRVRAVYAKTCLCNHLGNGALVELGIGNPGLPVAVCPGPNLAYFDREYSLRAMVDHIYGRGASLVPSTRPHCFAKELVMYVDHFEKRIALTATDEKARARLRSFKENLELGIAHYRALTREPAFDGENMESLAMAIDEQARRLDHIWHGTSRPDRAASGVAAMG